MGGQQTPPWSPRTALERARPYLLTLLVPLVVLAVGSLVVEYGFHVTPYGREVLHVIETVALVGLMLDPLLRLGLARQRMALLRYRWFDFVLVGAVVVFVCVVYGARLEGATPLLHAAVQVGTVLLVASRLVELQQYLATLRVRPALLLAGSFLTLIALGTGLLLLPAATAPGRQTTFSDAFFTATSAVCVTGLVVVDTGTHWSRFGQGVILVLIQLGGLGLMTFASVLAVLLMRGLRLRETVVIQETFTGDLRAEVRRVTLFILLSTLGIEAVGAALLTGLWDQTALGGVPTPGERIYYSVFHSVAAFCNAGFSLYRDSLTRYRATWQVNVVVPALIIAGGIGFGVLYNLARMVKYGLMRRRGVPLGKRRLNLQSKLALVMTLALLAGGTILILVLETYPPRADAWSCTAYGAAPSSEAVSTGDPEPWASASESPLGSTLPQRLRSAWFLATTARTAGFNTADTSRLSPPTKFLTTILMFIGASPGSTGGGIKTVTLAVILCGTWSALRARPLVQVFRRVIPIETVLRAMTVLAVCVIWVSLVATLLSAWGMQQGARFGFLDCLFEATSSFATVGLSTGATPLLNTFGRMLIAATMFFGRVGPLTLMVATHGHAEQPRYVYATENVAIS